MAKEKRTADQNGLKANLVLIGRLSKNDFKTKFAGSYLGVVWGFIQPIVTVLVYWFVFQKGLKANGVKLTDTINVPFVIWLLSGMIPWFFFSDSLNGGSRALLDYSYLVKKVVFNINILPIVKIISGIYTHVFFICFGLILNACYGFMPSLYTLQIFYYSICVFALVTGISYFCSAIVVFFRDMLQVINIVLQVGVWVTPIMWSINSFAENKTLCTILMLNPLYYVVEGYRDALIYQHWFWEKPWLTLYFWAFTGIFLWLGTGLFKKTKVHFADML